MRLTLTHMGQCQPGPALGAGLPRLVGSVALATFCCNYGTLLPSHMNPSLRHAWRLLEELPGKITFLHRWLSPRYIFQREGTIHAIPTLVACLQGVVRVRRIDGPILDLHPGEILLIAPGVRHEHAPILHDSIWFGQGFMAAWSDIVIGGQGVDWIGRIPTEPSLTLMGQSLMVPDDSGAKSLIHENLRVILSESVEALDLKRPELRAMIERLWACCDTGIRVDDLVLASGLSRAQAYNIFKRGYGVTPKQAIESMRLLLASSYIDSGMSAAEAALLTGYTSADSFRRAWKRKQQQKRFVRGPFIRPTLDGRNGGAKSAH